MKIIYKFYKRLPFQPPLALKHGDNTWTRDRGSNRIALLKYPMTSPFYTLLIYQMRKDAYAVAYNSTFFKYLIGFNRLYYRFYILQCVEKGVSVYVLYDIPRGCFRGKLTIPKSDICFRKRHVETRLETGYRDRMIIYCNVHGLTKGTIYIPVECNRKGRHLELRLANGTEIPSLMVLGRSICTFTENVYYLKVTRAVYIVYHLHSNRFWPQRQKIIVSPAEQVRTFQLKINLVIKT
jgi:hypothetical protein